MTGIFSSKQLYDQIIQCRLCASELPCTPRPIIQLSATAKVLIIGQAPGIKAHNSIQPWNDASGNRLRSWLGVDSNTFYDSGKIALVPMGFCYPGKGKSGDNPPMAVCAPTWHHKIIQLLNIRTTLLIGQYAQRYYLRDHLTLTQRVQQWRCYQPDYFVLPHPSPRNNIWLKRHPWFEREILPAMRAHMAKLF